MTQEMCDKVILENSGQLKSVPGRYKNLKTRNKAVDNYPHALELAPDWYTTQNICNKTYPFVLDSFPD